MLAVWEAAALMPASVVPAFQISTGLPVSSDLRPTSRRRPRIGRALQIGEGQRRAGIVEECREQLGHGDVRLVARGDAVAKAHALRLGEIDDGVAEAAGLERARHRTGAEIGLVRDAAEGGPHARLDREHALAVGADDAHAALGDCARLSSASSLRPSAPVSRKPAVSTTANGMPALPQSRMALATPGAGTATTARSHGSFSDIDVGIAREPVQLGILGIDREDAALVAGILERLDRVAADAGEVGGRADDGDAFGMEQTLEAQGQPLPRDPRPKANNKSPLPSSIFLRKSSALAVAVRNSQGGAP